MTFSRFEQAHTCMHTCEGRSHCIATVPASSNRTHNTQHGHTGYGPQLRALGSKCSMSWTFLRVQTQSLQVPRSAFLNPMGPA